MGRHGYIRRIGCSALVSPGCFDSSQTTVACGFEPVRLLCYFVAEKDPWSPRKEEVEGPEFHWGLIDDYDDDATRFLEVIP